MKDREFEALSEPENKSQTEVFTKDDMESAFLAGFDFEVPFNVWIDQFQNEKSKNTKRSSFWKMGQKDD